MSPLLPHSVTTRFHPGSDGAPDTEAALRASERRLRLAMDAARMGSFEWDIVGGRVYWSPAIERMHGIPEGSFDGTFESYKRDMHPEDEARVLGEVQASLQQGAAHHLKYRIVRPDGETRWLEAHGQYEKDEQGTPVRLIGVCSDVTDRVRMEESLRFQQYILRLVTENATSALFMLDDEGRVTYQNAAALAMTGFSPEELRDRRLHDLIHHHHADGAPYPIAECPIARALPAGESLRGHEDVFFRKDGSSFPVVCAISPIIEHGIGIGTVVEVRDVTEEHEIRDRLRQAAQESATRAEELSRLAGALERSNRELDQFAYVTSHDLKAPLRGIANLAQWIEEDLGDRITGESQEHMRLLQGRVTRMDALIDGILTYSRAGRVKVQPESVDTAALVHDVVELIAADGVRFEIDPTLPTIVVARVPLQQVFLNLISNAVKFTAGYRDDPVVRVGWRDVGSLVEFWVDDNGPGIAPEFHDRVWGIFQTLNPRDKVEGAGIGLSVVKKIVESRGGGVRLTSEPGHGATFSFFLPKTAHSSLR